MKKTLTAGIAAVLLAGSTAPAFAADAPPKLDPKVLRAAVKLTKDDKATGDLLRITGSAGHWSGTSGVGDLRTGAKVPLNGRYRIGSVTKVFTASVVLQLAAEGKINVSRTIQHYLPGLLPDDLPPITVGQLLDHTSGLSGDMSPHDPDDGTPAGYAAHRFDVWTPAQVVALSTRHGMEFAPGTKQHYEGINYFIAGLLIEKVTGHSYGAEVNRRIIKPLGLHDTSVPGFTDFKIPGPHSHGYVIVDGKPVDISEESPWAWAEGGMISSAADLDHFISALFTGKVVPPAQLKLMFTLPVGKDGKPLPYTDKSNCPGGTACYAMGLMQAKLPGVTTVAWGKTGSRPGYTNGIFATRDLARKAAYLINATGNKDGSETPIVIRLATAAFASH